MKYVDEYRDGALAQVIAEKIARAAHAGRQYRLMEFCGGTRMPFRATHHRPAACKCAHGHGPGCPVCVLPTGRIDSAIELASSTT